MEPGYLVETPPTLNAPSLGVKERWGTRMSSPFLSVYPQQRLLPLGRYSVLLFTFYSGSFSQLSLSGAPKAGAPGKGRGAQPAGRFPLLPTPAVAATCSLKLSAERERERRGILSLSLLEK